MSMVGKKVRVETQGIAPWVGEVEEEFAGGKILRVRVTNADPFTHKRVGDRWDVGAMACKEIG